MDPLVQRAVDEIEPLLVVWLGSQGPAMGPPVHGVTETEAALVVGSGGEAVPVPVPAAWVADSLPREKGAVAEAALEKMPVPLPVGPRLQVVPLEAV